MVRETNEAQGLPCSVFLNRVYIRLVGFLAWEGPTVRSIPTQDNTNTNTNKMQKHRYAPRGTATRDPSLEPNKTADCLDRSAAHVS
jgi:hypothetical protein